MSWEIGRKRPRKLKENRIKRLIFKIFDRYVSTQANKNANKNEFTYDTGILLLVPKLVSVAELFTCPTRGWGDSSEIKVLST